MAERGYRGYHNDGLDAGAGNKNATGWSVAGILTPKNVDNQVSLQANLGESGACSVQFSIGESVLTGPGQVSAQAEIKWSVAGNTITRRISLVDGMTISGFAELITVTAIDTSDTATATQYPVTISISKGVRSSNRIQPFLLDPASPVIVAAAGTTALAIPQHIGINAAYLKVTSTAGAVIPAQSTRAIFVTGIVDLLTDDWIPLFPGVKSVTFQNFNAFQVKVSVLWGIDG
jgi:hypothetical protein